MNDLVKVLIVDDTEEVRLKIKSILSVFPCDFFEAENKENALTLIKQNFFDVIFLDIMLPFGVTGIDVLKEAREIQLNLGKVIILTGWLEDNTRKEAETLGIFDYLDKAPLDRSKIRATFSRALIN